MEIKNLWNKLQLLQDFFLFKSLAIAIAQLDKKMLNSDLLKSNEHRNTSTTQTTINGYNKIL